MRCINKVVVAGNLGRDPEVGATPKGMLVAKFSVAVDTPRPGGAYRTVWFQCLALREQAELVKRNLNHGDPVFVEGSLEPYEYTVNGSKQRMKAFRILVDRIRPMGSATQPAAVEQDGNPDGILRAGCLPALNQP